MNDLQNDTITRNYLLNLKYAQLMRNQIDNHDTEAAHSEADDLLCNLFRELGFGEVVDLFDEVGKWYT